MEFWPILLRRLSLAMLAAWGAHCAMAAVPAASAVTAVPGVRVTLIKTAQAPVREALLVAGGDWSKQIMLNHVAVLVEHPLHPENHLMFDAGLSASVEVERETNLNWLFRQWPLLSYQSLHPARSQLPPELRPHTIALSHIHWDHLSGVADFPEAEVWTAPAERDFAQRARPPSVFPSHVRGKTEAWKSVAFSNTPVCGFQQTQDVYGDASVVLIAMPGHTPGSMGMLVTTGQGRKLLFVGDTVWLKRAVDEHLAKPLISRTADNAREQVMGQIEMIAACVHEDPHVEVIPAHDAATQDTLGYFPNWVH